MDRTIYIDRGGEDSVGIIFSGAEKADICWTGLEYLIEPQNADTQPLLNGLAGLCGIMMLTQRPPRPLPCYGAPFLCVFAEDGRGGYFAVAGDYPSRESGAPVCHLDQGFAPRVVAESLAGLFRMAVSDPDWRQKRLSGGPWPALPGNPAGRAALAAALGLDSAWRAADSRSSSPVRVFPSRQAAEAELPIKDIWDLVPSARFAIRRIAPEHYDGKGYVHYQAWQETYRGLMDERILENQTLERCQRIARQYPQNTLVLLDRAENNRVAGFACYMPQAGEFISIPGASELGALYLLEEYKGLGLGKRLMEAALEQLPNPTVALFVLEGNERAIGFYEHMGFRFTGHRRRDTLWGAEIRELEMALRR